MQNLTVSNMNMFARVIQKSNLFVIGRCDRHVQLSSSRTCTIHDPRRGRTRNVGAKPPATGTRHSRENPEYTVRKTPTWCLIQLFRQRLYQKSVKAYAKVVWEIPNRFQ